MEPENCAKSEKLSIFQIFYLSQNYMHKYITPYVQQMKLLWKKTEGYCSALALQEPQEKMQL